MACWLAKNDRLTNELVRERLGGLHSARIVLTSVSFADIEALQAAGQRDEAVVATLCQPCRVPCCARRGFMPDDGTLPGAHCQ